LLSYDIRSLIGERAIGLVVVDEAHLVTTWGRDFRVDYWFLGNHIEKIRKGSYYNKEVPKPFPVLCLTATAVFGGNDDVVGDLQDSLKLTCYPNHLYIGYVRRDNISFNIRRPIKEKASDKEEKVNLVVDAINGFIERKEKTIIYFPYKSQIEDVLINYKNSSFQEGYRQIEKYYSGNMTSMEKNEAYNKFRSNETMVMLATKAFGMGVNISDIVNVYHYAPTGTLADYVQEVGRAARSIPHGSAITDYLKTDMHYARTLWGLSGLRHYQIHAIMKKLYQLYREKGKRNLLFAPEVFNYLFDDIQVDTKVKSGLMLLATDLLEKYNFNVITVRPKNLYTKQYIVVPFRVQKEFLAEYGSFCKKVSDNYPTKIKEWGRDGKIVEETISKNGDVFEINLSELWESKFEKVTFARFKYEFFQGFLFGNDIAIVPNVRLSITFNDDYSEIKKQFTALTQALQNTFNDLKSTYGGKNFNFSNFVDFFKTHYKKKIRREYIQMLLDLFCYTPHSPVNMPKEQWKFVVRKKSGKDGVSYNSEYSILGNKAGYISQNLIRFFESIKPNLDSNTYVTYLGLMPNRDTQYFQQLMASMLQLFDSATYDISGGKNPAIFVRINDPLKLRRLVESNSSYKNRLLTEIEHRHKRAISIMNHFMGNEFSNEKRWEIIEDYFLGLNEIVDHKLGITND